MALICIDAWGIKRGPHGISRYCRSLIPPLVAAGARHDFVIVRPPRRHAADLLDPSGRAQEIELPLPKTDWATLAFRPWLEPVFRHHGRPDVYHALFHMLPLGLHRGRLGPARVIVTLHDLISLDFAGDIKRGALATAWATRFDRWVIPSALRHADHVICDSDATRRRAIEWVPLERSTTIHLGVEDAWRQVEPAPPAPLTAPLDPARPFVTAFGVARPYKNVACIARAVAIARQRRPELRLVLIGGDGGLSPGDVRLLGDGLVVMRRLDDAAVRTLIRDSCLFVVASRAEGFGLPLLEAMACGAPVAASDIAVLREVGGDAPEWFDPDDPSQLAGIVHRVLEDERLCAAMRERGRARAAGFTWSRTAAETLAVYDRVLTGRPPALG